MEFTKAEVPEQQHKLFDKLIDTFAAKLAAHGAEFIIKKHDGTLLQLGSLKLHEDKPEKAKRAFIVKKGAYMEVYGDVLDAMEPGDEYTFDVPEEFIVENFRGAVTSAASARWGGKGAHRTTVDMPARKVTVYRHAAPKITFGENDGSQGQ